MIFFIFLTGVLITIAKNSSNTPVAFPKSTFRNTQYGITFNPTEKNRIDVWEDFQCPVCKEFEYINGSTLASLALSHKAEVVFHSLSFLDAALKKHGSTLAANAGGCVANYSPVTWLKFHQALYANQPEENGPDLFTNTYLIKLAATVGASGSQFTNCVNSGKFLPWVSHVENNGGDQGITSTPTVLINGRETDRNTQYLSSSNFISALRMAGISL
jgi:protein-disulfide isomerase